MHALHQRDLNSIHGITSDQMAFREQNGPRHGRISIICTPTRSPSSRWRTARRPTSTSHTVSRYSFQNAGSKTVSMEFSIVIATRNSAEFVLLCCRFNGLLPCEQPCPQSALEMLIVVPLIAGAMGDRSSRSFHGIWRPFLAHCSRLRYHAHPYPPPR